MFSFTQTDTPAVKAHLDAQYQLLGDMSRKFLEMAQKIGELNMQATKSVMEESLNSAQQMMGAKDFYEAMAIATTQSQPASEKVRAYQQHLTNIAAQSQVDMVKAAETHAPNTARTASAVAEEIVRKGTEETEKAAQRQKVAMEKVNMATQRNTSGNGNGQSARTA